MTTPQAKRIILGAMLVTGGIAAAGAVITGKNTVGGWPRLRILVGTVIAMALLTILADPAPQIAVWLAVLATVTMLVMPLDPNAPAGSEGSKSIGRVVISQIGLDLGGGKTK